MLRKKETGFFPKEKQEQKQKNFGLVLSIKALDLHPNVKS